MFYEDLICHILFCYTLFILYLMLLQKKMLIVVSIMLGTQTYFATCIANPSYTILEYN